MTGKHQSSCDRSKLKSVFTLEEDAVVWEYSITFRSLNLLSPNYSRKLFIKLLLAYYTLRELSRTTTDAISNQHK